MNSQNNSTEMILGVVAEEFIACVRAGKTPDVAVFVARHPEHEVRIRELLETVGSLEVARPASESAPGPGLAISRIGEYVLERELGRGGMGIVFLARDETLGRRVALKLLPVQATLDERFLERFQREARAVALLQHPHIVSVHGVGEQDGVHYYAMQYIEGQALDVIVRAVRDIESQGKAPEDAESGSSLATRLMTRELSGSDAGSEETLRTPTTRDVVAQRDLLPFVAHRSIYHRNVARIGLQVADALAYAHGRGILHRDIKPANLILDGNGNTWVTDFGLCKTAGADDLTMTTDIVGTLRYMAPEQIEGRSDIRSDVYELGITLYELLTLQQPFRGKDRAALLRAIVDSSPPRPCKIRPDLPRDLEAIVLKATAKLPEERYGTAEALAEDLRAFLAGRAVSASPPSALRLLRLVVRRNRALAGTVAAFVLLLAVATTLYLQGIASARAEQDQQLYIASIGAAEATLTDNPEVARAHLARSPEALRNWEWAHLSAKLDDSLRTVETLGSATRSLAIDRDSGRLVFVDLAEELHVRGLGSSEWHWSIPASNCGQVSLAPGGKSAVGGGTFEAQVWSLEGAPTLISSRPIEAAIQSIAHDSSGQRVFLGLRNGSVHCFDAALVEEQLVLTGHPGGVESLVVAPDDRSLISGVSDGTIRVTDLDTRGFRDLRGHAGRVVSVDVSGDGRWIASGGWDGTVRLWDCESGEPLEVWQAHAGTVKCVRFSPDDEVLVSTSDDRTIGVFDPLSERRLRTLRGHGNVVWSAVFLPTGNLLSADEDGFIKEWDPHVAGGGLVLEGHVADVFGVAFNADAKRLLSWNRDGTVRLWDAETGRTLRVFLGPQSIPQSAVFSPDGALVASAYSDGGIRLWDIDRGEIFEELFGAAGEDEVLGSAHRVAFSPRGDRLFATEGQGRLLVWERQGSEYRYAFEEEIQGAFAITVSATGRWVAVGTTDGEVLLFETDPWRLAERRRLHTRSVHHVTFDPSSSTLLSAGNEGIVAVWKIGEPGPVREIRVEPRSSPRGSSILGLSVGPEGKRFVVSTLATGTSLWNLERGEKLIALRGSGRNDYPYSTFSPNGERVATGTSDGQIRVWDTMTVEQRRACVARETSRDVEARERVDALFMDTSNYDLVKRVLLDDQRLDPELREQALRLAHEDSGSLEGLVHRALRLLRSWKVGEAPYQRQLIHSSEPRVTRLYGESRLRQGDFDGARRHLEPIIQTDQKSGGFDVEAHILLAMTYSRLSRPEEAHAMLNSARGAVDDRNSALVTLLIEADELLREASETDDG